MSKLLKEAIADAKTVRETAIENARAIMDEAFTPKFQKMIATKLREELQDDDSVEDLATEIPEAEVSTEDDVPVDDLDTDVKETEIPVADDEVPVEDDNVEENEVDPTVDADGKKIVPEAEVEVSDDENKDEIPEGEGSNDTFDSVLKELEDEAGENEDEKDVPVEEADDINGDIDGTKKITEDDENDELTDTDVDVVDEKVVVPKDSKIVKEDDGEAKEPSADEDDELKSLKQENSILRKRLSENRQALATYKNQLHEINLLNAKLLYTNRLFNTFSLTNRDKMKVLDSFDRTKTVREAKLVFTSLHEAFVIKTTVNAKTRKINESASKATKSTATVDTKKTVIEEGNDELKLRFQRLANIKILAK